MQTLHRASDPLQSGYCGWQDRKAVAGELKSIYRAASAEEAARLLEVFAERPGKVSDDRMAGGGTGSDPVLRLAAGGAEDDLRPTRLSLNMQLRKVLRTGATFRAKRRQQADLSGRADRGAVENPDEGAAHINLHEVCERFISSPAATKR